MATGTSGSGEEPKPASRERPLRVVDVVRWSNAAVERYGLLWVEGEVGEVKRPSSGHVYFALKDKTSQLPAVMWRTTAQRLRFGFEAGLRVRVRGKLGVFDRDGRLQLYVDYAEPAGAGAEAAALEELKRRLAAEGLFADARKRPLPMLPRRPRRRRRPARRSRRTAAAGRRRCCRGGSAS